MYETILFPTDGSDASFQALDHALDITAAYEGVLHGLYVIDTSYPYGDVEGDGYDLDPIRAALRDVGERAIQRIEDRADQEGTSFVGMIREGSQVHQAIFAYADEIDADLIVMGTHGRHGVDRWLLGSVTEQVIRTAEIPVLTVRSTGE